ncbi:hypothetical protein DPMN_154933 [Dreissena polymorpha]|uniref:Ig-like domain-containing protein n=1 Tax=Dreissena polymorpha TaxID=45954 RepID=A0A9D4FRS3_DREPO|nr:hypothetical protein DPMN_154933 [Dreissena polymorpha]
MNEAVAAIEIQTNLNAWIVQRITNIWENEYLMFKRSVQKFSESIEFNARAMAFNLSKVLENTISDVSYSFSEIITTISNELVSGFSDFSGIGLKFSGGINVFGLPITDLDFEIVKSVGHVGKCSRFKEVFELFEDEDAYRIFGKFKTFISLGRFIRINRGGLGCAINKDGTKIQGRFHAEFSILFQSVFTDVFFNNNGLFMYYEILLANLFKTDLSVHAAWGSSWNELTFEVKATFRADGSGDGSFQDSYSSAITRAISDMADIASERIASAKNEINNAQRSIDRAKQWLSSKQREVRSANEEFDKAISKLEDAKSALEHAKKPFQQALEKVENAQQKLDRLCKLKDCKQICVPGIRLTTCTRSVWGGKISYPCTQWSGCIYSFSDPVCIAENLACSVIRAPAVLVLEGAELLLRVPMLLFDLAKAAVSVAQVVVDKSRVVLLAAENLLEIAKISMDATSAVLESAKQALEALNFVLRLGVAAINYIIENGIDAIVEIRNCGFETAIRTKDVGIFDIFCEINPFRLGWKKLRLKVNINDMVRSIWNAAKATAETILNMLTGRKKRAVEFNTKSAFYTLLRKARHIDLSNSTFKEFINQSIDTVSTTMGFRKSDAADDYDYRTEIFKTKCEIFSKVWLYLMEATYVAFNVSSGTEGEFFEPESLTKYSNITNRTLSLYDIGVDINVAATEFNMSISDLELLLEEARKNISSDNQLVEIQEMSNVYSKVMTSQKNETSTMEITMFWVHIMDNISRDYYEESTCINFMDCMHYSITILYELFDGENITNMEQSLETISEIENLLLNITTEHKITSNEVFKIANNLNANLTLLKELNMFCSTPPVMQSQLQNQTGSTGTRITLLCDVTGNPMPSVTWYKKTNLLVNETLKTLTIQNASSDDAGVYHCLSSNIVATIASNDAWIHVLGWLCC